MATHTREVYDPINSVSEDEDSPASYYASHYATRDDVVQATKAIHDAIKELNEKMVDDMAAAVDDAMVSLRSELLAEVKGLLGITTEEGEVSNAEYSDR